MQANAENYRIAYPEWGDIQISADDVWDEPGWVWIGRQHRHRLQINDRENMIASLQARISDLTVEGIAATSDSSNGFEWYELFGRGRGSLSCMMNLGWFLFRYGSMVVIVKVLRARSWASHHFS